MIACLYVPLFPLAARLRSEPELKEGAVVVLQGNGNAARVVAATRKARKAGIEPGMTLPQARALVPNLIARGRDAECERAAQQTLLEVAESFSPRIEDADEGVAYLDLEGHPLLRTPLSLPSPPAGVRGPQGPRLKNGGGRGDFLAGAEEPPRPSSSAASLDAPLTLPSPVKSDVGEGLAPSRSGAGGRQGRPYERYAGGREGRPYDADREPASRLARDILRAAEKAALPARVGVAASKLAARIAAGLPDSPTVVPEGEESRFLAPLPLEKLAPQMEIAATLERWGLVSIGDLAKLPEAEVASRLGEIGRELHAAARGIDPRPLEPYVPPPTFCEGMDLEWPLASLEPFLFVGHTALERLVVRLESHALACTRLEVTLRLDPDGHDVRAIALPAPTRDVKTLTTLVRLELEARPPGAPIAGFAFAALPDRTRRAQLSLFGPSALSPDRLATTIARLAALLGADRVGSPRPVDGHRPERYASASYAPPPPPATQTPPAKARGLLGVRVLRPPVPLEVIVEDIHSANDPVGAGLAPARADVSDAGGRQPSIVRRECDGGMRHAAGPPAAHGRPYGIKTPPETVPRIDGSVRVAAGPWSLEDGWWSETPADRDYWDVELSDGGLYRIYRDRADGSWYADGVYD